MKSKKGILNFFKEIIIIIIGVVIAFSLTNYGESLRESQSENDVLDQICLELKNNLLDLENDFAIHKIGYSSNLRAIRFFDEKQELSDSLIMDFYWMTRDEYVFANSTGYENLKSVGVNLVKDDTLRSVISFLYNGGFPRLTKGNTLFPDINEYLTPFFKDHFSLNRDLSKKYVLILNDSLSVSYPRKLEMGVYKTIGYIPLDRTALLANEEFRFLIANSLEYRSYKLAQYERCILNVKRAISRIEARR